MRRISAYHIVIPLLLSFPLYFILGIYFPVFLSSRPPESDLSTLFSSHIGFYPSRRPPWARREVKPIGEIFDTVVDLDMPPFPDLDVLAVDGLGLWDWESWSLMMEKFVPGAYQVRVGVANGYFGTTVAAAGPFFERDINQTNRNGRQPKEGWPLWDDRLTFTTISGFYDCQTTTPGSNYPELQSLGCESVISGTPHPMALYLAVADQVLNSTVDKNTISNFGQSLNFRNGITSWRYTWSPVGINGSFDIEYVAFASRNRPNLAAVQLQVTPRGGNYKARIIDAIDGRSAVRSFLGEKGVDPDLPYIYASNHPDGLPEVTAWTVSAANIFTGYTDISSRRIAEHPGDGSEMSIGQEWDVHLKNEHTAVFHKFVGVASSDKFDDPRGTAYETLRQASEDGWSVIFSEHIQAWNKLMAPNLVTDYRNPTTGTFPTNDPMIEKLQIAAITDRYYLMQNLMPEGSGLNDNGVAVGGLTSDTYGGLLFWDQDFWMYPGIAITSPYYARQILNARVKLFPRAKANAQAGYAQEEYGFDEKAVLYPWTSGRFGNATATGPALDYEYHINADIALAMFQDLAITGDEAYFWENFWPVIEGIGHTISTLLIRDGEGWSMKNMTDPDEYANNVVNGAFTLAAFAKVLNQTVEYQKERGLEVNSTWANMAVNINIPRAPSGITLEYEGMRNNVTVKQADVLLMTYPLAPPNYSLEQARLDLAYYNQMQSSDGPAMTYAIAAIDENRVASSGCAAYTQDMRARFPNLRGPFFQTSEQVNDDSNANGGISPAYPFLTANGGALQINPFGYLGLTLLKPDLHIRPSLPTPFKYMTLPDFYVKGNRFKAVMNNTHTSITMLPAEDEMGFMPAYPDPSMSMVVQYRDGSTIQETQYQISLGETIIVENNMYWQNLRTARNLLQCQPTSSTSPYVPGQFPIAATDGNAGTRWQPLLRTRSSITVDLSSTPYQQIEKISFDWGGRIPQRARVALKNRTTGADFDTAETVLDIEPLLPPRELDDEEVVPYMGNTMEFVPPSETWTARYVVLEIEGCVDCGDGAGATVGEFEIIGSMG